MAAYPRMPPCHTTVIPTNPPAHGNEQVVVSFITSSHLDRQADWGDERAATRGLVLALTPDVVGAALDTVCRSDCRCNPISTFSPSQQGSAVWQAGLLEALVSWLA